MNKYMLITLLISSILLGVSNVFFQKSAIAVGAINTTFWYYITGTIISTIVLLVNKQALVVDIVAIKWAIATAVTLTSSVILFNYAIQHSAITVASTIRSLSFVATLVISICVGYEIITWRIFIGICLGVASVLVLSHK